MFDTLGVFWTMKYPNFQDADMVKEWGFEPKALDVKIYTPSGFFYKYKEEGIPTDFPFSLRPIDVGPEDWCTAFGLEPNTPAGVLITRIGQRLGGLGVSYSMEKMIAMAREDEQSDQVTKQVVVNQFEKAAGWGV